MIQKSLFVVLILLLMLLMVLMVSGTGICGTGSQLRQKAKKAFDDGNYRDAFAHYETLSLDLKTEPEKIGDDLLMAIDALANLNRAHEVDAFREKVIALHNDNWRLLFAAARSYLNFQHHGFLIAGEFHRGSHRGGGDYANAFERDRVRALQLMARAAELPKPDASAREKKEKADFHFSLADMLMGQRGGNSAWQLQYLTDLTTLPDYEKGHYYGYRGDTPKGAPVDQEGNPIFYSVPETWESADSDGERWRWALFMAKGSGPSQASAADLKFADFLAGQFGVQTMATFSGFSPSAIDAVPDEESAILSLDTLKEDETIARLATGVKRFTLPDEFNFIRIYKDLNQHPRLANIFENRRQYEKAAKQWQMAGKQDRVEQITGNWGQFEPVMSRPAGKGAEVDFRFRNAGQVRFTAHAIDLKKLLDDVKAYIRSNPRNVDWNKENIDNIGYRIVQQNETRYIREEVADWTLELDPRPGHLDRRITVSTPLEQAGVYLLNAHVENGNTSNIIIWLDDTAIIKKPVEQGGMIYVADAVTGQPVSGANVEFFGYRREYQHNRGKDIRTEVDSFARRTDEKGMVMLSAGNVPTGPEAAALSPDMRWLIIATDDGGRMAHLGFTGVWYSHRSDYKYRQRKAFVITDRPVYRPEDKVKFKAWVRMAEYDQPDVSQYAGQKFKVQILTPRGEKVYEKIHTADKWAGIEGEYELPEDAQLGAYSLQVVGVGSGNFRVEEYKKPEFEVTVEAPSEPVMLGDSITAKITAKYYFGEPVTQATVKYKVLRHMETSRWYPPGPWDWLYGRGYGWRGLDYDWYPGWAGWGISGPLPEWRHAPSPPPEVVMENEAEIGEDGTLEITIDTEMAKLLHGDADHRYEIRAEVTDLSRRTIVGTGSVIAARKPFSVYVWMNQGYYRAGDTMTAHIDARRPDGKPVSGKGAVQLLKISYDENNQPVERAFERWEIELDGDGSESVKMIAAQPGQYRVSAMITDEKGRKVDGGDLITVRGSGENAEDFRFNPIELVCEKTTYAPGEKVRLMINTNQPDGAVLLFLRPAGGIYPKPHFLKMDGKSRIYEIEVTASDMPNFFVEAVTIADGKVHTAVREIAVPPEKRVQDIDETPDKDRYGPGEKASVKITITDEKGEPYAGSAVISVYDRAVEYIYGGSNVPEIAPFFWKWRRHHNPSTETNLGRAFQNLIAPGEKAMANLGVFGGRVADDEMMLTNGRMDRGMAGGRAMSRKMKAAPMMEAAEPMAPAPTAEADMAGEAPAEAELVTPTVRTEFADTAFWAADITTDKKGTATVEFTMPENLTSWKINAWGMGHGTRVGEAAAEVVTAKNLLLRLQAPRFFVQKDEVVLSANVHNYLETAKKARVVIELDRDVLQLNGPAQKTVTIEPQGEARVDWRVTVIAEGEAVVRMKALTDEESDAMEMRFPAYVHGMDKMVSFTGLIRPEKDAAKIVLTVPEERRPGASRLEVRYSPTLAAAMVDALPYLVDYPYGCTEQTLNRFLPTVITQNVIRRMGVDLSEVQEKRTNLNPQEIGDDRKRAEGWKRYERNPVFDEKTVEKMSQQGVDRLTDMQVSDGGWGWFSGWGEHSYPHTTAQVLRGLMTAKANGIAVVPGVIDRGVKWLENYQQKQVGLIENGRKEKKERPWKDHADNLDAFIYMVVTDAGVRNEKMGRFLYEDRNHLSVYAKALYGMALWQLEEKDRLDMILQNISQYLVTDAENGTAYLNLDNGGYWWYWYGSDIEANAYYLMLLSRTDPKGETARGLVKYLLNNRKHATWWNSTRDTALCIEAFAEYLAATGEDRPNMTVSVYYDGVRKKSVKITPENLFFFDNKFLLEGEDIEAGEHTIELRRDGEGPLYFNAYLSYFTLEDHITAAGLEIKVHRNYYRLEPKEKTVKVSGSRGQAMDQRVESYERIPLENLDTLKSGELAEVELIVESKNDYEYMVFEDMKAAGFEPVAVRSGYTREGMGAYVEYRDELVAFFVRRLARGKHSISYRLRAEIPGRFSALPTIAYGMYAPELRANSDEIKLRIED